ncbi:MAG: hypothetical protein ITD33_06190 [Nitrosarchaeum sp.]|nr:hypothetical protein [Nitrosarchaeum sp.]MBP0134531.1 hypothetical protein [Nitrosarchaeum sp.]
MVTFNEHLKSILEKILISHDMLAKLEDNFGDLDIIKKQLFKINGFFQVILDKFDTLESPSSDFLDLKSKIEFNLENYSFEKEIETMSELYSEDSKRLKNIRLKILESLESNQLMEKIECMLENV